MGILWAHTGAIGCIVLRLGAYVVLTAKHVHWPHIHCTFVIV